MLKNYRRVLFFEQNLLPMLKNSATLISSAPCQGVVDAQKFCDAYRIRSLPSWGRCLKILRRWLDFHPAAVWSMLFYDGGNTPLTSICMYSTSLLLDCSLSWNSRNEIRSHPYLWLTVVVFRRRGAYACFCVCLHAHSRSSDSPRLPPCEFPFGVHEF